MERVPEGKKDVPNRDEQIRRLLEKLTGHAAFGRLHGSFMRSPDETTQGSDRMGHLRRLLNDADSPTAFLQAWDAYAADVRVVGDILAQLIRDGWNDAAQELEQAIEWPGYLLPGESIMLHETVPVTVLIVDFPRTHAMLRWIRAGHWMDLDQYLDGESVKPLAQRLFEQYPSLLSYTANRHQRCDYEGWDLLAAYRADVLFPFVREALGIATDENRWMATAVPFLDAARPVAIGHGTYNDHLEVLPPFAIHHGGEFGFLFLAEQAEVLAQIPREHQHRVATWGFRLPRIIAEHAQQANEWMGAVSVGFHPEVHHGDWKQAGGAYPSHGCSDGYGAVLLDRRRYQYHDHLRRYNPMCHGGGVTLWKDGDDVAFLLQPR